ncbi:unnamed protein product [Cunninghamella echinulata]
MLDTIIHNKSTISSNGDGIQLLKWILTHYRHIVLSKGNARQSFKRGEITVNGIVTEETRILRSGDIVEIKYNKTLEALEKSFFNFQKAVKYTFEHKHPSELIWLLYNFQKAASGLIIIARSYQGKEYLIDKFNNGEIKLGMNVICHGQAPPTLEAIESTIRKDTTIPPTNNNQEKEDDNNNNNEEEEENDDDDDDMKEDMISTFNLTAKDIFYSYQVQSVTRSNNADYLSSITLELKTPWSSSAIRRFFYHHGYTIIGNSSGTRPLKTHKDKGLYMSLLSITMDKLITDQQQQQQDRLISVVQKEPEKFRLLREREQKFWQRSLDKRLKDMQQAGLDIDNPMDIIENYGKEPLPYILGEKEFCGLRFEINKSCLIPRKSSETLVNAAIPWLLQLSTTTSPRILDMGTGCGNLLLSILNKMPHGVGIGVDISEEALTMAKKNQQQLCNNEQQVSFLCKDMAQLDLKKDLNNEPVDLMICNPPYLSSGKIEKYHATIKNQPSQQQISLSYEPSQAIYADHDGYSWYMILSQLAPQFVQYPHGRVILETGKGMIDRILLIWEGWQVVETVKDKQGWDRCVILERKKQI